MKTLFNTKSFNLGLTTAYIIALAGCATDLPNSNTTGATEANWQQAKSNNTIEAYTQFLRNASDSPHAIEAKEQLKSLIQADLANLKEVVVTIDDQATDAAGRQIINGGVMKLVSDTLRKQGCHVIEAGSPNEVVISVSQSKFLSGTANSYWHFSSFETVDITFSKKGTGPIFRNKYDGPVNTGQEAHPFPSIRVKPVDDTAETDINPDAGTVWGAGVEFVAASNDPAVIGADKNAFQNYDWTATADSNAVVASLQKEFAQSPPLAVRDSTELVF